MKIKDIKHLIKEYFSEQLKYDESIPAAMRRRDIECMLIMFANEKENEEN